MSDVRLKRAGGCATLILDNPSRRNAMDVALLIALEERARAIQLDTSINVVVIRGAGDRAFCSGADLDAMCELPVEASVARMEALLHDALAAIAAIDVPVVAAIQGACIGGGVQLALAADMRIAADGASFAIPAAQAGLPYPFDALRKIVALMGEGKAKAFLLTLQKLDAQQAALAGLVEAVAAPDAFEASLAHLINVVTRLPRASAIAYKRMLSGLAAGDVAAAQAAHAGLHAQGLYLNALQEMAASRKDSSKGRT